MRPRKPRLRLVTDPNDAEAVRFLAESAEHQRRALAQILAELSNGVGSATDFVVAHFGVSPRQAEVLGRGQELFLLESLSRWRTEPPEGRARALAEVNRVRRVFEAELAAGGLDPEVREQHEAYVAALRREGEWVVEEAPPAAEPAQAGQWYHGSKTGLAKLFGLPKGSKANLDRWAAARLIELERVPNPVRRQRAWRARVVDPEAFVKAGGVLPAGGYRGG